MSSIAVKTLDSVSLDAVEEPSSGTSPVTGSGPTSLATDGGAGLQVGISPASAETDKTHVKVSVASIRFINVYSR